MRLLGVASPFVRTLRSNGGTYHDRFEASIMMGSWLVGFVACRQDGEDGDHLFLRVAR